MGRRKWVKAAHNYPLDSATEAGLDLLPRLHRHRLRKTAFPRAQREERVIREESAVLELLH